jgi:uncharacterized damage-inducible protein DinB
LIEYAQEESRRRDEGFQENPQALEVKIDIGAAPDVRTVVLHTFVVELHHAKWLLGEPITPWQKIPTESASSLIAAGDADFRKWQRSLKTQSEEQWDEVLVFPQPMEGIRASRRKCLAHTIFPGTRRWAQLATTLRSAG